MNSDGHVVLPSTLDSTRVRTPLPVLYSSVTPSSSYVVKEVLPCG